MHKPYHTLNSTLLFRCVNAWGAGGRPAADAARAGGREDPRVPGWPLAHQARRRRLQDRPLVWRAPAAGGGREHLSRGAGSGCGKDDQLSLFYSFVSVCVCVPHLIRAACVSWRACTFLYHVETIIIHDFTQLEAFLGRWRAELAPTHSFVFTARNGAPLTMQGVHRIFTSTSYRLASPQKRYFIIPSAAFAQNVTRPGFVIKRAAVTKKAACSFNICYHRFHSTSCCLPTLNPEPL